MVTLANISRTERRLSMTKPDSGLFKGTSGIEDFYGDAERVITERVKGLDLTPHPITQKQLSSKQRKRIRDRIKRRIATREEYQRFMWDRRFARRRKLGVNNFWKQERDRINDGEQFTRNWTPEQIADILGDKSPKFQSKAMEAHHSYNAKEFPHLANLGEVIYPATHDEHIKGWHGGNYRNSRPGKRIRRFREF